MRWRSPAAVGLLVAVLGGALMVVGSFLHWSTLAIGSSTGGSGSFRSSLTLDISYDGMLLVEGRVALVLGVAALLAAGLGARLAFAARLRQARWWAAGLAGLGLVVLATTALSLAEHPATVATLLQSSGNLRGSTVRVESGAGAWLALAGGALVVLGAAVLARRDLRRDDPDDDGAGSDVPVIVDTVG